MAGQQPSDGKVEGYQRIVNGKVVQVTGYAKRATPSSNAAKSVRRLPGRPRMAASPGTFSGGRDLPVRTKKRGKPEEEGAEVIDFPEIEPPS